MYLGHGPEKVYPLWKFFVEIDQKLVRRFLILGAAILLLGKEGASQKIVSGEPFLRELLSDTSTVYDIVLRRDFPQPLAIVENPSLLRGLLSAPQKLIRTRKGLFALLDGTGRVYEIKSTNGSLSAQRIDSTLFFGYNFGAQSFAWRDTLYSFGGYGYWRYNGHLRMYLSNRHEWELMATSREIPCYTNSESGFKTWFDQASGQLYVNKMNEASLGPDSIYRLDLPSKVWSPLGKNILPVDFLVGQINTPWGIFCRGKEDFTSFILLNLSRNQVFRLSERKSREVMRYEKPDSKFFFRNSALFIASDSIYKVSLSMSDFIPTDTRIYEGPAQVSLVSSTANLITQNWKTSMGMLACLILGFMGAGLIRKTSSPLQSTHQNQSEKPAIAVFDEKEKGLIRLISENSLQRQTTSIDDINRILGLSDKPPDLQKKHRSDTISSINQKYQYITRSENLLLKKNRSDVDKRSFEYYIEFKDYQSLERIM